MNAAAEATASSLALFSLHLLLPHCLAHCLLLRACPLSHRRRPFLVKGLEATLNKFILSLEFYDEAGRKKIATGACACATIFNSGAPKQ